MPPSQLKSLKASLRAEGIIGQQPSKKRKREPSRNGRTTDRDAVLGAIREKFNPFEVKVTSRGRDKYDYITRDGKSKPVVRGRPGVTKSMGEQLRKETLLVEMQRRKKVGGIMDRRFGEDNPGMAPEDKMLERFARSQQRRHQKSSVFDLEDSDEDMQLTHGGQALDFVGGDGMLDDFAEGDLGVSDDDNETRGNPRRRQHNPNDDFEVTPEDPERKKTKAEVMSEVIAKSKFYKQERQEAKEEDEEMREELDKELPNLFALLRPPGKVIPKQPETVRSAAFAANTAESDMKYDTAMREMVYDRRSKPTERTKTEEEKAEQAKRKQEDIEKKRLQRMAGDESVSEIDSDDELESNETENSSDEESEVLSEESFEQESDTSGTEPMPRQKEVNNDLSRQSNPNFDDEDDFFIEQDLLASSSDDDSESGDEIDDGTFNFDSDDDNPLIKVLPSANDSSSSSRGECPQTHQDLLLMAGHLYGETLHKFIQHIRMQFSTSLLAENKEKLANFSAVLVEHIHHLGSAAPPDFIGIQSIIRHVHSLAKTYSEEISFAFRTRLEGMGTKGHNLDGGDLVILTAIGSIFPTSDHFHQVVTPASLVMTRYLDHLPFTSLNDIAIGTFISTLLIQYQKLSKRYVPEVINFLRHSLLLLSPVQVPKQPVSEDFRLRSTSAMPHTLSFAEVFSSPTTEDKKQVLSASLLSTVSALVSTLAELWVDKSAFIEIFQPIIIILHHLSSKRCKPHLAKGLHDTLSKSNTLLLRLQNVSKLNRRFLTLHYHRPLPIKQSIPKYEDNFDPNRHYDPDKLRSEHNKLKAEFKKERKGALRELRKDARFMARESLREKKERDREYEQKYKRLVAEIQGEEGHEKNMYERERRNRKGRR